MQRLTAAQMAERLQTSEKTFKRDVREKGIPYIPVGKRGKRFDPVAVELHLRTVDEEAKPKGKVVAFKKPKGRKVVSMKFAEA